MKLARLTILAVSIATGLAIAETVAGRLEPKLVHHVPCATARPPFGNGFRPDCRCRWTLKLDGRPVFDTEFETDAKGFRLTPSSGPREKLAVFLGCSFTLGLGVEQRETLPYHFQEMTKYRALNRAGAGWGPHQALLVPAEPGADLAIYVMLGTHVERAAGALKYVGKYAAGFPAFSIQAGKLVHDGTFAEARPGWQWLSGFALARRLPAWRTDETIDLTVRLLTETSRKWPRFVVLAYPGTWTDADRPVIQRMRAAGLRVVQPVTMPDESRLRLADGHPTPQSYKRLAEWLAREMK